jgi:hypothetical protein
MITRNRFPCEVNTTARLYYIDNEWRKKANPDVYKDIQRRNEQDKKILLKQKKMKEMRDN